MKFSCSAADVSMPDDSLLESALKQKEHLYLATYQDDVETMPYHSVAECFDSVARWLIGVVIADGGGSPCAGKPAHFPPILATKK